MGDVTAISSTIQEFEGERFYLCGFYFQRKGKRLHRAVWEHHNGEIPEGYHVHHIDGDRANNDITNLSLMPGLAHITEHAREESRRENGRRAIVLAIAKAPEWHRSEEGRRWHSQNAKNIWEKREPRVCTCLFCGEEFYTKSTASTVKFCHQNCKAKYARRKKAGLL